MGKMTSSSHDCTWVDSNSGCELQSTVSRSCSTVSSWALTLMRINTQDLPDCPGINTQKGRSFARLRKRGPYKINPAHMVRSNIGSPTRIALLTDDVTRTGCHWVSTAHSTRLLRTCTTFYCDSRWWSFRNDGRIGLQHP